MEAHAHLTLKSDISQDNEKFYQTSSCLLERQGYTHFDYGLVVQRALMLIIS